MLAVYLISYLTFINPSFIPLKKRYVVPRRTEGGQGRASGVAESYSKRSNVDQMCIKVAVDRKEGKQNIKLSSDVPRVGWIRARVLRKRVDCGGKKTKRKML
jgi:hypothetical protein